MQTKVLSDHGITLLKSVAIGRPIEHVEHLNVIFFGSTGILTLKTFHTMTHKALKRPAFFGCCSGDLSGVIFFA